MKRYTKTIILSVVLLVLIALITLVMIYDVDLLLFNNLSIAGIQNKKLSVENLMAQQTIEESNNMSSKTKLTQSKNAFDVAKQENENIDESTIAIVQEATKQEKYFIEYLWVVLGNYASANNVAISIVTPGSTTVQEETENTNGENTNTNTSNTTTTTTTTATQAETQTNTTQNTTTNAVTSITNGIKITIEGRYANVADFVFDVENDKSLRFKLDNIKMSYKGNNKIQATFDVLSLSVEK